MPAKSKAQQKLFGIVRSYQKGELENPSPEVAKLALTMKKSDVKKIASTKHEGLPEKKKVDEGVGRAALLGGVGAAVAGPVGAAAGAALGASMGKKKVTGSVKKKKPIDISDPYGNVAKAKKKKVTRNEEVEVVDEKFATQYKDKSKLGQSSQRKSLGRGASINPDAKPSGYESKKEHRVTSKKLAKYQTKGTYNAHLNTEAKKFSELSTQRKPGEKKKPKKKREGFIFDASQPPSKRVKEELQLEGKKTKKKPTEKYKIRVTHNDDEGGKKTYVRFADRDRINKLRQKGDVQSVEMTAHGEPTDGSSKKTNTKTPAIKKVKKKEPKIDKNKEMKEGVLADKMRANNKALKAKWDKRGKKATEDAYRAFDDVKRTQDAMDKEMKEGVIARIKQGAKQHAAALEKRRYDKAMSTKGSPERKAEAQHLRNVRFNMQGRGPTSDTETPKDKKRKKISKILRDQD